MSIFFYNSNTTYRLRSKKLIKNWICKVILLHNYTIENISIIFCTESEIIKINREFLKHNYPTDIITFSYSDKKCINAELYIAVDVVKDNAKRYKQLYSHEMTRVIIHGILHLLGYNDNTLEQKIEMRSAENKFLKLQVTNA